MASLDVVEQVQDPDLVERDKEFYGAVREYLVLFLLFVILYSISYQLVYYFKRKREREDYFSVEEDGPYRFSLFLCTFTLAVALAAIFLLPFSIVTCEISLRYPDNYYMQWLNFSLLKLVWNMVFFFSNFCLLCMMPFVYFFMEAEGFSGWRTGIHSRVCETLITLFLLLTLLICLVWLISSWLSIGDGLDGTYLNVFPLLYSFVSLCGVLCTLLSLPVGIEHIIMWFGNQLVLPKADDQIDMLRMEEQDLKRRLTTQHLAGTSMPSSSPLLASSSQAMSSLVHRLKSPNPASDRHNGDEDRDGVIVAGTGTSQHEKSSSSDPLVCNGYTPLMSRADLKNRLVEVKQLQRDVRNRFGSNSFYWTLFFSLSTLFVLFLTGIALLSSGQSFIHLLFNSDALAMSATEVFLGRLKSSQTVLGSVGALLEMALVTFFALSSLIGVYTSESFASWRPRHGDTPMLLMIANCNLVLLLSSALPVLIRSLGISKFDLVGMFGNLHWLSNWYLVMIYHLIFFLTIIYLWTRRVTRSVVAKVGHFFNLVAKKKHDVYFQHRHSSSTDSLRFGAAMSSAGTPVQSPLSDHTPVLEEHDVSPLSSSSSLYDMSFSDSSVLLSSPAQSASLADGTHVTALNDLSSGHRHAAIDNTAGSAATGDAAIGHGSGEESSLSPSVHCSDVRARASLTPGVIDAV